MRYAHTHNSGLRAAAQTDRTRAGLRAAQTPEGRPPIPARLSGLLKTRTAKALLLAASAYVAPGMCMGGYYAVTGPQVVEGTMTAKEMTKNGSSPTLYVEQQYIMRLGDETFGDLTSRFNNSTAGPVQRLGVSAQVGCRYRIIADGVSFHPGLYLGISRDIARIGFTEGCHGYALPRAGQDAIPDAGWLHWPAPAQHIRYSQDHPRPP